MSRSLQGGSPHLMLDTERLLKAGYLALCHGDTKTSLTEKGSRPRRKRLVESTYYTWPRPAWCTIWYIIYIIIIWYIQHTWYIQHISCYIWPRVHKMLRSKAPAGTEKLIGTGLPLGTKPPSRRFLLKSYFSEKRFWTKAKLCNITGLPWMRAAPKRKV